MNNKTELVKQLIVLSVILTLVIIVAIVLNVGEKKKVPINTIKEQTINQNEIDKEKQILDNLKGLLEEPQTDDYIQEPEEETKDMITTTNSGETVIIRE